MNAGRVLLCATLFLGTGPGATADPKAPLAGAVIVVDPGHGGQRYSKSYTGGTRGVKSGRTESELNLRVAVELAKLLKEAGATVHLTREADHRLSREGSSNSDELHARIDHFEHHNPHFFLSVHHNAGPATATGHTALYKHNATDDTLYEALAREANDALDGAVPGPKRKLIKGNYHILRETTIPGTIAESGFLTNAEFDDLANRLAFPKAEAEALCKAAVRYWTGHKDVLITLRDRLTKERTAKPRDPKTFTATALNPALRDEMTKLLAQVAPDGKYDAARVGDYVAAFRKIVVTDPAATFTVKAEATAKGIKLTGETSDRRYHDRLIDLLVAMKLYEITNEVRLPKTASKERGLSWIEVSTGKTGFVRQPAGTPFVPWGFNYDHDEKGRLLEDYWDDEWAKIEGDFAEMKQLGANVVRVHLQLGKFLDGPDKPNAAALDRLAKLVRLAETTGLYLDLTGLGCYHKADVPAWYDKLTEADRWAAQARFWEAVAGRCADSPAVFCYDLMNEPVVPGGRRKVGDGDWLGPAFGDKHFVQFISLDQKDRPRPDIARQWIDHLVTAIRKVDRRHLITVGLVDWSLDRPGLTSGFVPEKVTEKLDFIAVHLYPQAGKLDAATKTLQGFAVGKPVIVEETFPLKCSPKDLDEFIARSGKDAAGWISFYWGKPPEELRKSKGIAEAITLQWLELMEKRVETIEK